MEGHTVVLDVGKTLAKVSLWTAEGVLLEKRSRLNQKVRDRGYDALDVQGIETWLVEMLADLARKGPIAAIVPVAHGAGVAVLRDGRLHAAPMDYESPLPEGERVRYEQQRDSFNRTGSPALPNGLNLGAQLHLLESLDGSTLGRGVTLLLWPQYWAWRLSGVAAAELSSLGCHTDLWYPAEQAPSGLAIRRGWADCLPPLRSAADCLGTLTSEWSERTGLSADVRIYCGMHDSNAALLAARGFPEISDEEATVLSTGTWFVAMRTPGSGVGLPDLPEGRDCLINVDVRGRPVPSARFMGGREIEILTGVDSRLTDITSNQSGVAALSRALEAGTQLLPTFAPGCGPYPRATGRWIQMPAEEAARGAAVSLYAALVADTSLDLIGARDRLVVEGRFAAAEVFVRALASLRHDTQVFVANTQNDVSYGALRLLDPQLPPSSRLRSVEPLQLDLQSVQQVCRRQAQQLENAA